MFRVTLAGEFDDVGNTADYVLQGRFHVCGYDDYYKVGRKESLEMIEQITAR